jgi:hypothetical protein
LSSDFLNFVFRVTFLFFSDLKVSLVVAIQGKNEQERLNKAKRLPRELERGAIVVRGAMVVGLINRHFQ